MNLFSRKRTTANHSDRLKQLLAEYFVVDEKLAGTWLSSDSDEHVRVALPFAAHSQHPIIKDWLNTEWQRRFASQPCPTIQLDTHIVAMHTQQTPVRNIKNIIAVASGKGGVGKSATAVNLAFALQQEGARVGILDADIYGPSIPIMLGNAAEQATSADNKHMQPMMSHGLAANSIGYLVPAENATVWRGPMASRALSQLLNDTLWPVLDYLLVDMPPGTGDIQLTMAQQVPLTAAVVVTTPQDLALTDAKKGIAMFEKVEIPVLGLIENMSYYQCGHCGEKAYIFAQHGGERLAKQHHLPLLGSLPLDLHIREHADSGVPLLKARPDSPLSSAYLEAARSISQQLALTLSVNEHAASVVKGDPIMFKPV
ncbi:iron-sulfur cluster carrier protein ApbC [Alteromonas oceanisediminis]|uniref:iron-sulfur cluster carrier protein ApbC n=1 Tax=Alteromonas oceanisediminis TaxID=2836180 RepID=UPI001BDB123F|nr:iron-sulfur cluster carrier protein ApbC [Alteromonas oceanisediminis]MBT0587393.1 iron-sulfur cluster carrier protein ApbC [Alteromonas oceanisediminis]